MDATTYLEHLRSDARLFLQAAAKDLDARVPSCPDWSVAELTAHLGEVYQSRALVVERLANGRVDLEEQPPQGRVALEFCSRWFERLEQALASTPADTPVWTWWPPQQNVGFWLRRMAQETLVQRWDVENAVGDPGRLDPELSADGIDEFLSIFVPGEEVAYEGKPGLVTLERSDGSNRWVMQLEPGAVPELVHQGTPSVSVRGTAEELELFVWRRRDPSTVSVDGDSGVLDDFFAFLEAPGQ